MKRKNIYDFDGKLIGFCVLHDDGTQTAFIKPQGTKIQFCGDHQFSQMNEKYSRPNEEEYIRKALENNWRNRKNTDFADVQTGRFTYKDPMPMSEKDRRYFINGDFENINLTTMHPWHRERLLKQSEEYILQTLMGGIKTVPKNAKKAVDKSAGAMKKLKAAMEKISIDPPKKKIRLLPSDDLELDNMPMPSPSYYDKAVNEPMLRLGDAKPVEQEEEDKPSIMDITKRFCK